MEKFKLPQEIKNKEELQDICYRIANDEFKAATKKEKIQRAKKLYKALFEKTKESHFGEKERLEAILFGIKNALIKEDEERLITLIDERYQVINQIDRLKNEMREVIYESFKAVEEEIKHSDQNSPALNLLNEFLLDASELKEVFKEVVQVALIAVIESGEDIKDSLKELCKNLLFYAVNETEFSKERVLKASKIILSEAVTIAHESKIYANDIVEGAIVGTNDGILKAIESFKDKIRFAPKEISLEFSAPQEELSTLEDDFIELIKNIAQNTPEPTKTMVDDIVKKEYDNYLSRIKRLSSDLADQLRWKLEEININQTYKEIRTMANTKLDEIKSDLKQKSANVMENLELEERLSKMKKDFEEFEKSVSAKFGELKQRAFKKEDPKEIAKRTVEMTKENLEQKKQESDENDSKSS
ncbi:hypothetical protein [uncultured Campylobacter sp.]|uniref:hypothetical protein n=1 Tax=uncultured Campylobacter sp. TaxID=218934 RepID=UPI002617F65C|nr:hypothetical protein [uncultured Campylobacter sp.]